jgi:hypothetical protein
MTRGDAVDFTRRPTTPGWTACRGLPYARTLSTRDGDYLLEHVHGEWKAPADHGPLSYRYVYAVTFPDDVRRVEFTTLGGMTAGEMISSALWHERNGLATVTRPARKLARAKRRST